MPTPPPLGYAADWPIHTFEVDRHKRMTVPALIQALQESAMQNVLQLKLSVWDLEPQGISWVLMKFRLQLHNLPCLGDTMRIVTYPAGFEKFFTYRDYRAYASDGQLLAEASSQWVLMDTAARKMTRIPEEILALEARMSNRAEWLDRPGRRLPTADTYSTERRYLVDHYDLDFNGHLSNQLYFRWLLETLPTDYLTSRTPRTVELHFRAEARWQDSVTASGATLSEGSFVQQLRRDEQVLATGYVTF